MGLNNIHFSVRTWARAWAPSLNGAYKPNFQKKSMKLNCHSLEIGVEGGVRGAKQKTSMEEHGYFLELHICKQDGKHAGIKGHGVKFICGGTYLEQTQADSLQLDEELFEALSSRNINKNSFEVCDAPWRSTGYMGVTHSWIHSCTLNAFSTAAGQARGGGGVIVINFERSHWKVPKTCFEGVTWIHFCPSEVPIVSYK